MKIYLEREDEEIEVDFEGTVLELLRELKINRHSVVIDINGKITDYEDTVSKEDMIRVHDIVTGG